MTDSNYTALLLVIDRSGSMHSIRTPMINGLEELLRAQAAKPGRLTVDIVTFDNTSEWTHSFANPADVQIELVPRGATALYDATGLAITEFGARLAKLNEDERPGTVQVVVVTDGHENASTEWTSDAVKAAVKTQTEQYSWDFVFLGANQDAVFAAANLGIGADAALTYAASAAGVGGASDALNRYMSSARAGNREGFSSAERDAASGSTAPDPASASGSTTRPRGK